MRDEPLTAAEQALEVARNLPPAATELGHVSLIEELLDHVANWAQQVTDVSLERFTNVCNQWRHHRPACPNVDRLCSRCDELRRAQAAAAPN